MAVETNCQNRNLKAPAFTPNRSESRIFQSALSGVEEQPPAPEPAPNRSEAAIFQTALSGVEKQQLHSIRLRDRRDRLGLNISRMSTTGVSMKRRLWRLCAGFGRFQSCPFMEEIKGAVRRVFSVVWCAPCRGLLRLDRCAFLVGGGVVQTLSRWPACMSVRACTSAFRPYRPRRNPSETCCKFPFGRFLATLTFQPSAKFLGVFKNALSRVHRWWPPEEGRRQS